MLNLNLYSFIKKEYAVINDTQRCNMHFDKILIKETELN